jgi:seryl-tRNA synthetase
LSAIAGISCVAGVSSSTSMVSRDWTYFAGFNRTFRAIINYGLEFLHDREYVPLQTPQLMLRDQMAKTAQLSQ